MSMNRRIDNKNMKYKHAGIFIKPRKLKHLQEIECV